MTMRNITMRNMGAVMSITTTMRSMGTVIVMSIITTMGNMGILITV